MLVNLTPHPIRIYPPDCPDRIDPDGVTPTLTIEPSGQVARIGEVQLGTAHVQGCPVPVQYVEYGWANGLPARPEPGAVIDRWYIVSLAFALACDRPDVLVPYREVRNLDGTVVGCRFLARPC